MRGRTETLDRRQPVQVEPTLPAAAGRQATLVVEDLRTSLRAGKGVVDAVRGVSLELRAGSTVGIVGESGSGKSMLMRSIMGIIPDDLVASRSGRVLLDGRDLVTASRKELRSLWATEIAMVLQDPMTSLNPVVRIGRQMTEGLTHRLGMSRGEATERAIEGLRAVRIPEPERRMRQYPHELSGGMRQRVAIAMALTCNPRLLIADEPTTALDVTVQAQVLDLLAEQQREHGVAMLLVTHDLSVVAGRTHRTVVMYAGKVVEEAPTREIFRSPRMPYTEALIGSVPKGDGKPHARLRAIPGMPPDLSKPVRGCPFSTRCRYAQDRCLDEEPSLTNATEDHKYACWYPVGTPEGRSALAINLERGSTATGAPVTVDELGGPTS